MKKAIRKYAGVIYIALMSAAVLIVLSCTDELGQVWTAMGSLDGRWVFAALGCIAAYLFPVSYTHLDVYKRQVLSNFDAERTHI